MRNLGKNFTCILLVVIIVRYYIQLLVVIVVSFGGYRELLLSKF